MRGSEFVGHAFSDREKGQMNLLKLLKDRAAGNVKITLAKNCTHDLKTVIKRVGLSAEPSDLRNIGREEAVDTVSEVLWRDLAYHHELIENEQARQAALRFVDEFALADAEFYNNRQASGDSSVWSPVSNSTFDLCLLIVNADSAICVVAEDED